MPHHIIWGWYTGCWWVGCYISPAQAPPRCTKCNSRPINGQSTNNGIAVPLLCGTQGVNRFPRTGRGICYVALSCSQCLNCWGVGEVQPQLSVCQTPPAKCLRKTPLQGGGHVQPSQLRFAGDVLDVIRPTARSVLLNGCMWLLISDHGDVYAALASTVHWLFTFTSQILCIFYLS